MRFQYRILIYFQLSAQQFYAEFQHGVWDLTNSIGKDRMNLDPQTYRQIRFYSVVGPAALPPDQLDRVCMTFV